MLTVDEFFDLVSAKLAAGVSHKALAAAADVSVPTIERWAKRKMSPLLRSEVLRFTAASSIKDLRP